MKQKAKTESVQFDQGQCWARDEMRGEVIMKRPQTQQGKTCCAVCASIAPGLSVQHCPDVTE